MLTKSDFMSYTRCPVELWLKKYQKHLIPKTDAATQRIFDTGNEVDFLARGLYPGGVAIRGGSTAESRDNTRKTIKKGAKILYQPTAFSKDLIARADVLTEGSKPGTWDIREIKSSTKVKDEYLTDLAFQRICFEDAGFVIGKTFLVHINNKYVRHGEIDLEQLLTAEDVTADVQELLAETRQEISLALKYLDKHKDFSELLIQSCSKPHRCDYLGYCIVGHPEVYKIADKLPEKYLLALLKRELLDPTKLKPELLKKIGYVAPVPFNEVDTKQIKSELRQLKYPLYFIDYETYGHAIPPFDNMRPYQQVPFQYALFIQESRDSKLKFVEFLAREFVNPVPEFLAHLREHMGPTGSIIVWHEPFESGKNEEMVNFAPQFKKFVEDMNERMFDLLLIFKFKRKLYIHSDFEKRASLKIVLPVICPHLAYDSLAIQEGGTASASWPVLTNKKTPEKTRQKLVLDMLAYCKRDSEAMVCILAHLYDRIEKEK